MRSSKISRRAISTDPRGFGRCYGRLLRIKMDSALNRPVEDWGKLLGDVAAVTAMLDRILHHGHVQVRPTQLAHQGVCRKCTVIVGRRAGGAHEALPHTPPGGQTP